MKSSRFGKIRHSVLACLALLVSLDLSATSRQPVLTRTAHLDQTEAGRKLSGLRIPFVANAGQTDSAVAFYAPTFAGTAFVTRDGKIVYSLPGWALTESPVKGKPRLAGGTPALTGVSDFRGNDPSRWRCGLSTFEDVSLGEVWPGISIGIRAIGRTVEKVFTVAPGGDPSRIRMSIAGARGLRLDREGDLVVETGSGEVAFTRPSAFQEREGAKYSVRVAYELRNHAYGFTLAGYDPELPVVIDPLLQATYLGGSGEDYAQALAIHPTSGAVYVTGYTNSANFPGTVGGAQTAAGGGYDVFVASLSPDLTTLNQATYLGGSGNDFPNALVINPISGDVYAAGSTESGNFPGTVGGAQTGSSGGGDAFVVRLSSDLTTLDQATYLGGSGGDYAYGLAIDAASGDVFVAGSTSSTDLPATGGGYQTALGGTSGFTDAFVARLSSDLTALDRATYLGGSRDDYANAVAIDPGSGNVDVAGYTVSTDLPGTGGGAQTAVGGSVDAFVARLSSDLTALDQATYLGGSTADYATALAIHPSSGEVYVAGYTSSVDFPGTLGGAQQAKNGYNDSFVARLSSDLTTLDQATYLGGSGNDEAPLALAVNPSSGGVYVAGYTLALDFPGTDESAQEANGGGYDAFVAWLSSDLTALDRATYLGGTENEFALALAIEASSGDVYAAGWTGSTNFPGTSGGAQETSDGSAMAFVARLTGDLSGEEEAGEWPRVLKQGVLSELQALLAKVTDKGDRGKLNDAIKHLTKSLDPRSWLDDSHVKKGRGGESVFNEEKPAADRLRDLIRRNRSGLTSGQLQPLIDDLTAADRELAETAIGDAIAASGKPGDIARANAELARGDASASAGRRDAIDHYKNAWKAVVH